MLLEQVKTSRGEDLFTGSLTKLWNKLGTRNTENQEQKQANWTTIAYNNWCIYTQENKWLTSNRWDWLIAMTTNKGYQDNKQGANPKATRRQACNF